MNKQEALKRIEAQKETIIELTGWAVFMYIETLIEQLDEPEKVTIPQFVADYIEFAKKHDWNLRDVFLDVGCDDPFGSDVFNWLYKKRNNIDVLARAWLDGYEIEKDKRYLVKVKGVYLNSCLVFDKGKKKWFFSSIYEIEHQIGHHTRKELEQAGFGEVFNSPLFEVEEVEE